MTRPKAPAKPRRRPRPYHHGDLRAALLDAVATLIREAGVGAVSLREVARRLGVSHAAPAHHFPNKAALLTAFATQGYARLAEAIEAAIDAIPSTPDPRDRLRAVGRGYVHFALSNPAHFGTMFRVDNLDQSQPDYVAASEAAFGALRSTIEACAQAGHIAAGRAPIVAISAWSIVHGFASLWLDGRLADRVGHGADPRVLAAAVADLFVTSVMGPATTPEDD